MNAETQERKIIGKERNNYTAIFDCFDKTLIALSTAGGVISNFFASIVGAPVGIATASFSLVFSLPTRIIKKILKITRIEKKKHDKVVMLTTSKSNSVNQTLISEALNILKLIMNNIKQSSIQKKITEAKRKY